MGRKTNPQLKAFPSRWPVTPRQRETLNFVCEFHRHHGMAPTQVEIGEALNITHQGAAYLILCLRQKGILACQPGKPRSLVCRRTGEIERFLNDCAAPVLNSYRHNGKPLSPFAISRRTKLPQSLCAYLIRAYELWRDHYGEPVI